MLNSLLPSSSSESEEESIPPSSNEKDITKKEAEPKNEEQRLRFQEVGNNLHRRVYLCTWAFKYAPTCCMLQRLTALSGQIKALASKNEAKRILALRKQATRAGKVFLHSRGSKTPAFPSLLTEN